MSTDILQQDWENRQFVQNVQYNIVHIVHFLNKFETSTRYRLAKLNERLINLERQMEYLEYSVANVMEKTGLPPLQRQELIVSPPYMTVEQEQEIIQEQQQQEYEQQQQAQYMQEEQQFVQQDPAYAQQGDPAFDQQQYGEIAT
eukprot:gb/GEZN01019826.1/.p1 GENE.gb/GEZN01019826.1/~~gb/GEZN01019826.1/.p1  ORF type:complete len:144 (-),score=41.84 gb/GEZN01019826.1/:188-619(-)